MIQPACDELRERLLLVRGQLRQVGADLRRARTARRRPGSFASSGTTTSLAGSGAGVGDEQAAAARTTSEANAMSGFM